MTSPLVRRAQRLGALHAERNPLVLPTVWDAWSARLAVECGFEALTVGSNPLAASLGAADEEGLRLDDVVAAVRRITAAVDVPVSVDLESGYGVAPDQLIEELLAGGGVGLNVEDTVHSDGGRRRSAAEHADYVQGLRVAADAAGGPVWINARTDAFFGVARPDEVADDAIAGLRAFVEAGADSVYPIGLRDDDIVTRVVAAVAVPVNLSADPAGADLARFVRLGVRRVTFGPFLQRALDARARELLAAWR